MNNNINKIFGKHAATDSRNVRAGGLFIALEGERVDGHDYIDQAVSNGAEIIIVRTGKRPDKVYKGVEFIELDEPELDLARIASRRLEDNKTLREVIAITGSVGKTTTREAVKLVLSSKFKVHAAEQSFNTRIGCTCTVLAMPEDAEILLLEFGANKPGEILELTQLFNPSIAIITQVAPVHLEGFKSIEGVLRGKLEILKSNKIKTFLYNSDNKLLSGEALRLNDLDKFGVGFESLDFKIKDVNFNFDEKSGMPLLKFKLNNDELSAAVWGEHNAYPLSFAGALGNLLGVKDFAASLKEFAPLDGRGRIYKLDNLILIDDAYNANPASMRASLETFIFINIKHEIKKIAVLGEMREMGGDAVKYHAEIAELFNKLDLVILVGEIWREAVKLDNNILFADDWRGALNIINNNKDNCMALLKGSHSIGLQNIARELVKNAE
ncbi:MAG: UDP-N-acetylmuramoyl-tripeptide--D-alanyl-D-alanine ligase [Synergistaceae bacterium]|nr:UDP-N-acetylmuramoyl-tripeptide--D-alanyl-D-alanine ligase [Synergistaceae bacterium]